jgi:hypothetical protein
MFSSPRGILPCLRRRPSLVSSKSTGRLAAAGDLHVEAVEKVPRQILGRDAEKSDLIECATINDLMLGKGQVTPENVVLTRQKDFSCRLVRWHQI